MLRPREFLQVFPLFESIWKFDSVTFWNSIKIFFFSYLLNFNIYFQKPYSTTLMLILHIITTFSFSFWHKLFQFLGTRIIRKENKKNFNTIFWNLNTCFHLFNPVFVMIFRKLLNDLFHYPEMIIGISF